MATFREYLLEAEEPMDTLKRAVDNAKNFMDVGKQLKAVGIKKYDFSTEMIPIYMIDLKGSRYAIVNKKNVNNPDYVKGDIALGKM